MSIKGALAEYVDAVLDEFVREADPEEERWPDYNSMAPLRAELTEVIDGCVADWIIEQRESIAGRTA